MSSYRLRSNTNFEKNKRDISKLNFDMDNLQKSNITCNDSYIFNPNRNNFHTSYKDYSQMNISESPIMQNPFSQPTIINNIKTTNFEFTPRIRNKRIENTTPFTDSRLIRHASKIFILNIKTSLLYTKRPFEENFLQLLSVAAAFCIEFAVSPGNFNLGTQGVGEAGNWRRPVCRQISGFRSV